MKIEIPLAFSFIMPDELYFLKKDKTQAAEHEALPPAVGIPPENFKFMGGNKKNFLVIVHYPESEFIEDNHFKALESILKRLGFSMDDVAIVNKAKYSSVTIERLTGFFKPERLLMLGRSALPAGAGPLTLNKTQQLNNCNTLLSFSFDEMMDNNENKKVFWEQMKQL